RVRRLRGGAPAARQGGHRPPALPRALPRRTGRAAVVRTRLLVPPGPPPPPGPGRPRRPHAGRRLRADRLQDRPPEDAVAATRRRPAVAVCGWGARSLAPGGGEPVLLLRARQREGVGPARGGRCRLAARHRARGGGRDPGAGIRTDALLRGLLGVRLPDRVPGGRALT